MEQRVCVIGGSTWDVLFTTSQADLVNVGGRRTEPLLAFPYGGKVDATDVIYGFGGGAANVSVGLSYLGVKVDVITRVGREWRGNEIIKNFHSFGVGVKGVQKDRQQKTAMAFIVTAGRGHDHVAFVSRGATININIPQRLSKKYQWCYVTALASKDWHKKLLSLFKSFSSQGGKIFWNPGATQLADPIKMAQLLKYVTVLDLNNDEAALLLKRLKHLKTSSINILIKNLRLLGPELVLITSGRNGAYLDDGNKIIHHPIYGVKPVNTTGAGDAFGSGFLAGYLASGWNLNVAMQWGMLNSNSVIIHPGAQKGILSLSTLPKFRATYDET